MIIKYLILGFGKIIGGILCGLAQGELPIRHLTFSEEL